MIWGPGWGFGGGAFVGLIGMLVFWGLVITGIVLLVRSSRRSSAAGSGAAYYGRPDPLQVLDERFARGEIDAEEYRTRRDILRERRDRP